MLSMQGWWWLFVFCNITKKQHNSYIELKTGKKGYLQGGGSRIPFRSNLIYTFKRKCKLPQKMSSCFAFSFSFKFSVSCILRTTVARVGENRYLSNAPFSTVRIPLQVDISMTKSTNGGFQVVGRCCYEQDTIYNGVGTRFGYHCLPTTPNQLACGSEGHSAAMPCGLQF